MNQVLMEWQDGGEDTSLYAAPKLTADDEFLSATQLGMLVYRVPAPHTLMGVAMESLSTRTSMKFVIQIQARALGGSVRLACLDGAESRCTLTYQRHYTPTLYYLAPPVVYFEAPVSLNFNPYSTAHLNKERNQITLASDEMPFLNAKINGAHISFVGSVDFQTHLDWWTNY
jgi:hypothetical protein